MALKFVICGLEHSGTTLLSDIFRQVKSLDSGFEVGVLLGSSPRDFPNTLPFFNHMPGGWKIDPEVLKQISAIDSFEDFYDKLKVNSEIMDESVEDIFDKTPRYFSDIYGCYEKVKVPFVGVYKDPRSLVYSDFKRSGDSNEFESWYEQYKEPKLNYLLNSYNKSYLKWKANCIKSGADAQEILCISLEEICLNTRATLEKVFAHVGYKFDLEYVMLKNLRYQHTRQPQISSRIPFEYLEKLTKKQMTLIETDFALLKDWFYH